MKIYFKGKIYERSKEDAETAIAMGAIAVKKGETIEDIESRLESSKTELQKITEFLSQDGMLEKVKAIINSVN